MGKSIYSQHSESTLLETAKVLVEWQGNLLKGRARPNDVNISAEKMQKRGLEDCCPDSTPMMYDAGDYRNQIESINRALSKIFLLDNTRALTDELDKYQGE
jgi:hypothetical protein